MFLTIAGFGELEVVAFVRRAAEVRGEVVRMFDNSLADGTDNRKLAWEVQTYAMVHADVIALEAVINAGPVSCTSDEDIFGDTERVCKVEVVGSSFGPDVQTSTEDWSSSNQSLALVLREV